MVTMERLASPEKMEKTPSFYPPRNPSHASSAQQDPPVPTDPWDPKDHPDPKELPASHHAMEFPAILAWPDNQAPWADPDAKVHEEHPEHPVVSSPSPVHKAHKDLLAHPANKDPRVNPAPMVNHLPVHPANLASLENPAKKVVPDHPDHPVRPATMEKKEVAIIVQNPAHHPATKRNTPTEHSRFRKIGDGTLSITLIFCFLFTTGRKKQKNRF